MSTEQITVVLTKSHDSSSSCSDAERRPPASTVRGLHLQVG
uniref:Uncharacterized protein n=1 Tax=Anguilla anguilla TaxID=7936 RepID=A0A0E9PQU5_ANGAN